MKLKLPHSAYNWITVIGATISIISLFMIIFLFVVATVFHQQHSYLGLIIYMVLPAFLILGLILIPIGMLIKTKRDKGKVIKLKKDLPVIDLNNIRQRNAFAIFAVGTSIFLLLSAIGSYEAFHFTESVEFCGEICHSVMKPEYVAYQNSPHARVRCVDCHVGEGADWYVRSKFSGMYQVYAVAADVYPKPIPTPITNLRPARETCEECHWPQKFYPRKLEVQRHYLADEDNTEWDIHMTMKVSASMSSQGLAEGIHWHINPSVKIEYITTDSSHQEIPWVRYTNLKTGLSRIYNDEDNMLNEEELSNYEIKTMDCIDCHNRPAHVYQPPAFFLDEALSSGFIPKELPEIKYVAIELCDAEYETSEHAFEAIDSTINEYYAENYPEIAEEKPELITTAIEGIQDVFSTNIFPEMKVRWDAYPNNIGHLEYNGCFRCHSDTHIAETGNIISKDCNLCHEINAQGNPENLMAAEFGKALEFKHPVDIDGMWQEVFCTECHTGLAP